MHARASADRRAHRGTEAGGRTTRDWWLLVSGMAIGDERLAVASGNGHALGCFQLYRGARDTTIGLACWGGHW